MNVIFNETFLTELSRIDNSIEFTKYSLGTITSFDKETLFYHEGEIENTVNILWDINSRTLRTFIRPTPEERTWLTELPIETEHLIVRLYYRSHSIAEEVAFILCGDAIKSRSLSVPADSFVLNLEANLINISLPEDINIISNITSNISADTEFLEGPSTLAGISVLAPAGIISPTDLVARTPFLKYVNNLNTDIVNSLPYLSLVGEHVGSNYVIPTIKNIELNLPPTLDPAGGILYISGKVTIEKLAIVGGYYNSTDTTTVDEDLYEFVEYLDFDISTDTSNSSSIKFDKENLTLTYGPSQGIPMTIKILVSTVNPPIPPSYERSTLVKEFTISQQTSWLITATKGKVFEINDQYSLIISAPTRQFGVSEETISIYISEDNLNIDDISIEYSDNFSEYFRVINSSISYEGVSIKIILSISTEQVYDPAELKEGQITIISSEISSKILNLSVGREGFFSNVQEIKFPKSNTFVNTWATKLMLQPNENLNQDIYWKEIPELGRYSNLSVTPTRNLFGDDLSEITVQGDKSFRLSNDLNDYITFIQISESELDLPNSTWTEDIDKLRTTPQYQLPITSSTEFYIKLNSNNSQIPINSISSISLGIVSNQPTIAEIIPISGVENQVKFITTDNDNLEDVSKLINYEFDEFEGIPIKIEVSKLTTKEEEFTAWLRITGLFSGRAEEWPIRIIISETNKNNFKQNIFYVGEESPIYFTSPVTINEFRLTNPDEVFVIDSGVEIIRDEYINHYVTLSTSTNNFTGYPLTYLGDLEIIGDGEEAGSTSDLTYQLLSDIIFPSITLNSADYLPILSYEEGSYYEIKLITVPGTTLTIEVEDGAGFTSNLISTETSGEYRLAIQAVSENIGSDDIKLGTVTLTSRVINSNFSTNDQINTNYSQDKLDNIIGVDVKKLSVRQSPKERNTLVVLGDLGVARGDLPELREYLIKSPNQLDFIKELQVTASNLCIPTWNDLRKSLQVTTEAILPSNYLPGNITSSGEIIGFEDNWFHDRSPSVGFNSVEDTISGNISFDQQGYRYGLVLQDKIFLGDSLHNKLDLLANSNGTLEISAGFIKLVEDENLPDWISLNINDIILSEGSNLSIVVSSEAGEIGNSNITVIAPINNLPTDHLESVTVRCIDPTGALHVCDLQITSNGIDEFTVAELGSIPGEDLYFNAFGYLKGSGISRLTTVTTYSPNVFRVECDLGEVDYEIISGDTSQGRILYFNIKLEDNISTVISIDNDDFKIPFRTGTLKIFVHDELVWQRKITQESLYFKLNKLATNQFNLRGYYLNDKNIENDFSIESSLISQNWLIRGTSYGIDSLTTSEGSKLDYTKFIASVTNLGNSVEVTLDYPSIIDENIIAVLTCNPILQITGQTSELTVDIIITLPNLFNRNG